MPHPSVPIFAGIEAGGTKFVCATGSGCGPDLDHRVEFPTTDPDATMERFVGWLSSSGVQPAGIGLASFGPVDLRPGSPTYGRLLSTPKPRWQGFDLVGFLRTHLAGVPVGLDTDVNAAAVGEQRWGAAQGCSCVLYLTVGTGIGGGVLIGGTPVHGLMHPEVGHMRVGHDRVIDPFAGTCPYHGDCWEGLAAGPAIQQRWGSPGPELGADHPAWDLEASYLAAGIANLILALSPEKVVVGGGVGSARYLLDRVRSGVEHLLAGYVPVISDFGSLIVAPGLGRDSGVLGAIALGREASLVRR
jgi:fructokinase